MTARHHNEPPAVASAPARPPAPQTLTGAASLRRHVTGRGRGPGPGLGAGLREGRALGCEGSWRLAAPRKAASGWMTAFCCDALPAGRRW